MLRIQRVVRGVKVAVWSVFLFVFPAVSFANGMYAAAALLSVLGLLLDVSELGSLLPGSTAPKIRRGVVASVALMHASLLVAACVRLVFPTYGAWQRVDGTEDWNNPSLVRAPHGPLLAVGGGDLFSLGEGGRFSAVSGIEGPILVLGAGAHRAWFLDAESKVAWGYDGTSVKEVPLGAGFARTSRGAVMAPHGAALDDALFFVRRGALVRVELDGRQRVVIDGRAVSGVATAGARVVAVGDHVFVSEDGGRRFEARDPLQLPAPMVFAGGGAYYVVQGGLLSSKLFVSEAGGPLEARDAPVRDLRDLAVDPRDGRRLWAASWGEGVWRSEDGGRSWKDLELEGLEIQALVVDFGTGERAGDGAWVAATNLAIPSGLFHHAAR
jgi:hypothetical protein